MAARTPRHTAPAQDPAPAPTAGYSSTPLARKLGIRTNAIVCTIDAPAHYQALLAPLPPGVRFVKTASRADLVHLFVTRRLTLTAQLKRLRATVRADAAVWVSWPKQSSKVDTDITDNVIRDLALPLGLVDIKVCAVDTVWSGLKLVIRVENRQPRQP